MTNDTPKANLLLKAAKAYYWDDDPIMSDYQYDQLWKEFCASDEEHPLITTKGSSSSSLFYIPEEDYPE
jgi:NAD-dependent DNA ligase